MIWVFVGKPIQHLPQTRPGGLRVFLRSVRQHALGLDAVGRVRRADLDRSAGRVEAGPEDLVPSAEVIYVW